MKHNVKHSFTGNANKNAVRVNVFWQFPQTIKFGVNGYLIFMT